MLQNKELENSNKTVNQVTLSTPAPQIARRLPNENVAQINIKFIDNKVVKAGSFSLLSLVCSLKIMLTILLVLSHFSMNR